MGADVVELKLTRDINETTAMVPAELTREPVRLPLAA